MSTRLRCVAWDGGAIAKAIKEVIGVSLPQATTMTVCGRRRALSQIDNEHPTCQDCIAELTEREVMRRTLEHALEDERTRCSAGLR